MPDVVQIPGRMLPVGALKMQVMGLDAAMLVAVASPEAGAVHKLRTWIRRVEAQIVLLDVLSVGARPLVLPRHAAEVDAVRKRLRTVRQAAGAVRDLDVQVSTIRSDAPAKAEVHAGTPGDGIRREAKLLRRHLEGRREHEAAKLSEVLRAEEEKLAVSLHALEQVLKPAARKTVAQAVLADGIERWFAQAARGAMRVRLRVGESPKGGLQRTVQGLEDDALHTVRKAAKLCRYMAESAAGNAAGSALRVSPAGAMAERFEAMQGAGGRWHDWLMLERLSSDFHGKNAKLTERYRRHLHAALEEYRLRLMGLLPVVSR